MKTTNQIKSNQIKSKRREEKRREEKRREEKRELNMKWKIIRKCALERRKKEIKILKCRPEREDNKSLDYRGTNSTYSSLSFSITNEWHSHYQC